MRNQKPSNTQSILIFELRSQNWSIEVRFYLLWDDLGRGRAPPGSVQRSLPWNRTPSLQPPASKQSRSPGQCNPRREKRAPPRRRHCHRRAAPRRDSRTPWHRRRPCPPGPRFVGSNREKCGKNRGEWSNSLLFFFLKLNPFKMDINK